MKWLENGSAGDNGKIKGKAQSMDIQGKLQRNVIIGTVCASVALCTVTRTGFADNFADAHYDASSDELVVTMRYQGTNPNHTFAIQWGPCSPPQEGSSDNRADATLTDDQWRDAARHGQR